MLNIKCLGRDEPWHKHPHTLCLYPESPTTHSPWSVKSQKAEVVDTGERYLAHSSISALPGGLGMLYPAGQQLTHPFSQALLQLLCKLLHTSPGLCVCFNKCLTALWSLHIKREPSSAGRMKPGTPGFWIFFYIFWLIFHSKSE